MSKEELTLKAIVRKVQGMSGNNIEITDEKLHEGRWASNPVFGFKLQNKADFPFKRNEDVEVVIRRRK